MDTEEPEASFTVKLFPRRTQMHVDAANGDPADLLRRAIVVLETELSDLHKCPYHARQRR